MGNTANIISIIIMALVLIALFIRPRKLRGKPAPVKRFKRPSPKAACKNIFDRYTCMLYGHIPREDVVQWYKDMKQKLKVDGFFITHLAVSTKVMDHFNCDYKPIKACEDKYLTMIQDDDEHRHVKHLGFACAKDEGNDLHKDCVLHGTVGWDQLSYVPFVRITVRRSMIHKLNMDEYIKSCQQLCHWQWITQYRMDYGSTIYLKQIDGYIIEGNDTRLVLDERHRAEGYK